MPTHLVNLDSLIRREDFEVSADEATVGNEPLFKIEELAKDKLYFSVLRKPDFQRQTDNWSPEIIVDFIRSFLDGELIPSIIIWHSRQTGKVFIIDGAHRVSALIAWVNDDYGDGEISRKAWNYKVPPAQVKLHERTKELVKEQIGSFAHLLFVGLNASSADDEKQLLRARAIATRQQDIQRVEGSAQVAERSFFKINGNPATIDDTELDVIRARNKPNTIATRALIASGKGHRYWAKFKDNAQKIEALAGEVYDSLFGQIVEIGAQSPDLPRAGQPYSSEAFKMVLDLVNIFNDITPAMWQVREGARKRKDTVAKLADDVDGSATLELLAKIKSVARLSGGTDYSGSLGLDQAVYCYGATGKFHPAAFLASLKFAQELRDQDRLFEFTAIRADFEEFLVRHKSFINLLGHSKGSRTRSLESILIMYRLIFRSILSGEKLDEKIVNLLQSDPKLNDLKLPVIVDDGAPRRKFSRSAVAAGLVDEILKTRGRCTECGARLPPFSRSKDHIIREEDGGLGTAGNLHFTHPYCNTGYKEKRHTQESAPEGITSRPLEALRAAIAEGDASSLAEGDAFTQVR